MSTTLHKLMPYVVNLLTKGEGVKNECPHLEMRYLPLNTPDDLGYLSFFMKKDSLEMIPAIFLSP